MKDIKDLTDIEKDVLKEFVNVGTGHAATSLGKLIDGTITITVPELNVMPLGDVPGKLGGPEQRIVGLFFKIYGEMTGSIMVFFPKPSADNLAKLLTMGMGSIQDSEGTYDEMGRSSLMELGNILANSYVNALAEMLDIKVLISVPFFAEDFLGAVIDPMLIEIAMESDYAMLMETIMDSDAASLVAPATGTPAVRMGGTFIIFPDTPTLEKIFAKIGIS
jgi:chemotaxis protein CheC